MQEENIEQWSHIEVQLLGQAGLTNLSVSCPAHQPNSKQDSYMHFCNKTLL